MSCGGQGHHGGTPGRHHGRGGMHGHHHWHGSGCGCGCGAKFRFGACFATRDEKVAWLEEYLKGLQKEAGAVEKQIAKLREEA